jgi:hypothetical protein
LNSTVEPRFHDLTLLTIQQLTRLPVVPVPAGRVQPVDPAEVADRLVELALGAPAGLVADQQVLIRLRMRRFCCHHPACHAAPSPSRSPA